MPTTNPAGFASIYIESQSPSSGWIRGKLQSNSNVTDEEIDVIDRTTKRSAHIWHGDRSLMSINNKEIFKIPKTFIAAQTWFLANEAARCYDKDSIPPLLLKDEI